MFVLEHRRLTIECRCRFPPSNYSANSPVELEAVEKLKTAQRASLAELDALFASLQHRAFRGEL